jgi:CheY-like chemotaxis protein
MPNSRRNRAWRTGATRLELARLRRSEQALRAENDALREGRAFLADARDDFADICEWAPSALVTLTAQGTIQSANLATAELFGRAPSALVGRAFVSLFHEWDLAALHACVSGGRGTCAARLMLPDQTPVAVDVSRRFSVRHPGNVHVAVIAAPRLDLLAPNVECRAPVTDWCHILLVEDHDETAEALRAVFARAGYRVTWAGSMKAAVSADLSCVEVVVSDIVLPDGLGTDLLRQLKQRHDVTAVAFSALTKPSDVAAAIRAGFELFFRKPGDLTLLLKALRSLLATRQQRLMPALA